MSLFQRSRITAGSPNKLWSSDGPSFYRSGKRCSFNRLLSSICLKKVTVAGFLSTILLIISVKKYVFINFHTELGSCLRACTWATGVCRTRSAMDNLYLVWGETTPTSSCCDLESAGLSVIHPRCHRAPHSWSKHILHFSSFFCSYQATWWHKGRGKKGATARTCVGRSKRCMKIKARRQSKSTVCMIVLT